MADRQNRFRRLWLPGDCPREGCARYWPSSAESTCPPRSCSGCPSSWRLWHRGPGARGGCAGTPDGPPPELGRRRIMVRTKQGEMFTTRVRERVTRSVEGVLVRETGTAE